MHLSNSAYTDWDIIDMAVSKNPLFKYVIMAEKDVYLIVIVSRLESGTTNIYFQKSWTRQLSLINIFYHPWTLLALTRDTAGSWSTLTRDWFGANKSLTELGWKLNDKPLPGHR